MLSQELYSVAVEYMEYLTLHGKSYLTMEEFTARQALYQRADDLIKAHNATESSFKLGHNRYSDATEYEMKRMLGGRASKGDQDAVWLQSTSLPESVDWRTEGAVGPVQD